MTDTTTLPVAKLYIAISGLIGAGKSTLARELGKVMNLPSHFEGVSTNPYLEDFYQDMAKHAFAMQIHLLNARARQQQSIVWQDLGAVQDRSIYEDLVFAKMLCDSGLMERRNYETYLEMFRTVSSQMQRPNVIVYLDVTPEEALRRIALRGRECEKPITIEYLRALHTAYEAFITEISRTIPVIRVGYANFHDTEAIAQAILRKYNSLVNVTEADL